MLELATAQRILRADGQGEAGGRARGGADGDAAADQGAERREEALAGGLDRRGVGAVLLDIAEAIEQVRLRNADVVEDDRAVVDAGQSALGAVIAGRHTREVVALVVANLHDEAVYAVRSGFFVVRTLGDELREDGGVLGVARRATDVRLLRGRGRAVDDEFLGLRVERRLRGEVLHIGAAADLGHREAADDRQVDGAREVLLADLLAAEVGDGAAPQPPLHAGLDHGRQVDHAEHLE